MYSPFIVILFNIDLLNSFYNSIIQKLQYFYKILHILYIYKFFIFFSFQELHSLQEHNTTLRKRYEKLRSEKDVIEYKLHQLLSYYHSDLIVKDTICAEQLQNTIPLAWELLKGVSAES